MPDLTTSPQRLPFETAPDGFDLRQAMLRILALGSVAYALFLPLDLALRATHFPELSPWFCVGWRLGGAALIVVVWAFVRARDQLGPSALFFAGFIAMVASLVCIAMMAMEMGGLETTHTLAPAYYAIPIAAFLPTHWRVSLAISLPSTAVFYALIALGVANDPELAPQFDDPLIVSDFVLALFRVSGIVAFAVVSGHLLWRTRTRLADAYKLGRYLMRSLIGQGGMSEVWLAWDTHLKRNIALKLLQLDHPDDRRRERFEREARAMSRLKSPHTIRVFDFGQTGRQTVWIAMEYLEGLDLDRIVTATGPLDARRAVHFARQAAIALAEAHNLRVVHRDIKPANLVVLGDKDQADALKVLDFGIAQDLDTQENKLTLVGTFVGTPAFMAPEVLAGVAASPASDIWSFGATLYALLTAKLPYSPLAQSHHNAARPRVQAPSEVLGHALPDGLDELVLRCLDDVAQRRPADGAALLEALDRLDIAPWTLDEARQWWDDYAAVLRPVPTPNTAPTAQS